MAASFQTHAPCGSWWREPANSSVVDFSLETTFSGNETWSVVARAERCGGCFVFHLHAPLSCRLGAISFLSQGGSFDSMVFLIVMMILMACIGVLMTQYKRVMPHGILQGAFPLTTNWKKGWRGWLLYSLLFALLLSALQSKLIYTHASLTTARRINIAVTAVTTTFAGCLLLLLQDLWLYRQTDPSSGKCSEYIGPRRPPICFRLLSMLGFVCGQPNCSAHTGPRNISINRAAGGLANESQPYRLRIHLHDRPTKVLASGLIALILIGWLLYPLSALILAYNLPTEDDSIMTARQEAFTTLFEVSYVWFQASIALICVDFVLGLFFYNSVGLGGVYGLRNKLASRHCAACEKYVSNLDSRALAPGHHQHAVPGRMDSEAAVEHAWLIAIASVFPVLKAMIGFAVITGLHCPYTEAKDDSRGDPSEDPYFDVYNMMEVGTLLFLFTFDSFPRRLESKIANFTKEARDVRTEAIWLTRLTSVGFALLFVVHARILKRNDNLVDEVLFAVGFFLTLLIIADVRVSALMILPIKCEEFRQSWRRLIASIIIIVTCVLLLAVWLVALIDARTLGRFGNSLLDFSLGIALWPLLAAIVVKVVMALHCPVIKMEVVDPSVPSIFQRTLSGATLPASESKSKRMRNRFSGKFSIVSRWSLLDDVTQIVAVAVTGWIVWTLLLSTLALLLVYIVAFYLTGIVMAELWRHKNDRLEGDHMTGDSSMVNRSHVDEQSKDGEQSVTNPKFSCDGSPSVLSAGGDRLDWSLSARTSTNSLADPSFPENTVHRSFTSASSRSSSDLDSESASDDYRTNTSSAFDSERTQNEMCKPKGLTNAASLRQSAITCGVRFAVLALLFTFSHLWYFNSTQRPPYVSQPLVIGHRGVWMEGVPELSFEAADRAKDAGFHGVEFDVRLTKDGFPILMHDDTVDRTTNGAGFVRDFSLAELKRLHLKGSSRGETVYTLDEYLDYLKVLNLIASIELKQGVDPKVVPRALDSVCRAAFTNQSFFATAEFRYQDLLADLAPGMSLEKDFLYHIGPNALSVPANANIVGIAAEFLLFNPWVMKAAHQAHQYVMVYFLVLESDLMYKWLLNIGVDMLMINDPAVCVRSGICPAKHDQILPRVMCEDAMDRSRACELEPSKG